MDELTALDEARGLLEYALAGPAGEDDYSVAPLRRIIAALEEERCDFDCDTCAYDGEMATETGGFVVGDREWS